MSELILPKAAELRQMLLPQILALLGKVEHADRVLANEPPDSPARKKNAFVRRRLLHLCGESSQFEINPDYVATEERIQYEEERFRARERGEELNWLMEQFFKSKPSFEPWPPDEITEEKHDDEFTKSAGLVDSLQAFASNKTKRLNLIQRLLQSDQEHSDQEADARINKISKATANAAEENTERVGSNDPPMPTKRLKVKQVKKATKKKKAAAKVSPISAAPYFFQVPGPSCQQPRDLKDIRRTDDYLFIALLIERSRLSGWHNGPRPSHLPTHQQSTKTLRRILLKKLNFWTLRSFFQDPAPPPFTITINNHLICRDGKWRSRSFIKSLQSIRHPIAIGKPDQFLLNLHAQRFYNWCELNQPEPCTLTGVPPEQPKLPPKTLKNQKKRDRMLSKWLATKDINIHFQLICPLDGPVTPLTVSVASPPSTWGSLCGRAYSYLHCPHCLAQLHGQLAFRN